jgi:Spy/CpxP family protein refolding chaperone
VSDNVIMIKLTGLALVAAAAFAVTSLNAGDKKGCCAQGASNHGKKECSQTYAKLNLSPEQKTKLDAFQAQCDKAGCTKESMAKFMKSAKGILSNEQFATLKTECDKHVGKTQS